MVTTSTTRWLLAFTVLLCFVLPTHAQPEVPRKYVEFKIDPQFEKLLKDRLQMEKQLGPLKDLIKNIADDPSKFPLDPEQFKDLKLEDPQFKKALQDWATNDPKLKQALRDWIKQTPPDMQPEEVKKFQNDLKQILNKTPPKLPVLPKLPPPDPLAKEPITPKVDPIAKAAEEAMKKAENSKLGDWLQDSPAWKRAFEDLRSSMNNPDLPQFKLADWQNKLRLPEGKAWQLGEGVLDRLPKLPRPNLERFKLPGMGNVSMPNVSAPALPNVSTPSLPSVGAGMSWLLLLLLCMLVGWQLLRWTKPSKLIVSERERLGPCPVNLETISTRTELVKAFDYLALLTLGLRVQSWNHLAVSLLWREQAPPCTKSAQALAQLYEQARYTEGSEQLNEADRATACRSLHEVSEAL